MFTRLHALCKLRLQNDVNIFLSFFLNFLASSKNCELFVRTSMDGRASKRTDGRALCVMIVRETKIQSKKNRKGLFNVGFRIATGAHRSYFFSKQLNITALQY